MIRIVRFFIFVMAIAVLTSSGFGEEREPSGACKRCAMRIDTANKRFAVTVSEGIEASAFDDIGCAMRWRDGECAMRTSAFDANARVYDFRTLEPIIIDQAFFVYQSGLRTPMGYDIAAFKTRQEAEKLVHERAQGKVVSFGELCSLKLR